MRNPKAEYLSNNLIGSRLFDLRKKKGVTLIEIQECTGYSHSIISRWERGIYTPNVFALIALAEYFEVTTDYILHLE